MAQHAFIIGGTGQIGQAIAANLMRHGWSVTAAHRGGRRPPIDLIERGLRLVAMDRDDPASFKKGLASGADAVIDTVAYTEAHADQLLSVEGSVGTLLVISSASVYRDDKGRTLVGAQQDGFPELPSPISETQATVDPGPDTYSTRKVALERRLLERARMPVTVLRPCAIHGPQSGHPREWWFVKRMLDKRKAIPLAYDGRSLFHTTSVHNIAELVRVAAKNVGTRVLNIGDPDPPSVAEIGRLIADRLGYRGRMVGLREAGYPPSVGATPWSTPRPFLIDSQAAAEIGYRPVTTYADAIAETCYWLLSVAGTAPWQDLFPVLAQYPRDPFDYANEDRTLEELAG